MVALATRILERELGRYDMAVRAWAAQDPKVARMVKKVDKTRFGVVRELLHEIGFEGPELEMRTRCFVAYLSLEGGLSVKQTKSERWDSINRLCKLLTQ